MQGKGSDIKSTLLTLVAFLAVGTLIIGGTIWVIVDLNSPESGGPSVATAATNYTLFVGRHW